MSGDYQPIAMKIVSIGWGVLLSVAGIICVAREARRKPRSIATKVAMALAGLLALASIAVVVFSVIIFTS